MALFTNTDMLLKFDGLKDQDGNVITGADVRATVYQPDSKTEVSGMTWPITLSDDGNGNYSAVLEDSMELKLGSLHWIKLDISGGGADDQRWISEIAKRRGAND